MKLTTLVLIALIFVGCKSTTKETDILKKDVVISDKIIHHYSFDTKGNIKIDSVISLLYQNGQIFSSSSEIKIYTYNGKGNLVSIISPKNKEHFFYNEQDSLILNYIVNKNSDTISLQKITYANNKKHMSLTRFVHLSLEDFDDIHPTSNKNDTLSTLSLYEYKNDNLIEVITSDINNRINAEKHYLYKNNRPYKILNYSFLKGIKHLKETTYLNLQNEKGITKYSLDFNGDTTTKTTIAVVNQMKIISNYIKELNSYTIEYYNYKNQLEYLVTIDLNEKTKRIYEHQYNDKGNIIEETGYFGKYNTR